MILSTTEQTALKEYLQKELKGWSADNSLLFTTFALSLLVRDEPIHITKKKCYDEFPEFLGNSNLVLKQEHFSIPMNPVSLHFGQL